MKLWICVFSIIIISSSSSSCWCWIIIIIIISSSIIIIIIIIIIVIMMMIIIIIIIIIYCIRVFIISYLISLEIGKTAWSPQASSSPRTWARHPAPSRINHHYR